MYIKELHIKNYRSLREVDIVGMEPMTAFHGPNNAGKSNILAALEAIFRRKLREEAGLAEGEAIESRPVYFWKGIIENFEDNFYLDTTAPIRFTIEMRFKAGEILSTIEAPVKPEARKLLTKQQTREDRMIITGTIYRPPEGPSATFEVNQVQLNPKTGKPGLIYRQKGDKIEHFPAISIKEEKIKVALFEQMMSPLDDCFRIVPSERSLNHSEPFPANDSTIPMVAQRFKGWLYQTSINRDSRYKFEEIASIFNAPPFNYGEISFARIRGNIEIMIKKGELRLPINRVGSGLQQLLFLVASMIDSEGKILGIEELEINLSPKLQNLTVKKLNDYLKKKNPFFHQLLMTTHSDKFSYRRGDVKSYSVSMPQTATNVAVMTRAAMRSYYRP